MVACRVGWYRLTLSFLQQTVIWKDNLQKNFIEYKFYKNVSRYDKTGQGISITGGFVAYRVGWYRLTLSLGTLAKWHNLLLSNLPLPLLVSFQVEWGEGILSNLSLTLPFLVSFQGHRRRCLICLIQFVFVFIDEFSGRMGRYFIRFVFVFVSDVLSHLSLSLLMRFQVESRWVLICFYPIP